MAANRTLTAEAILALLDSHADALRKMGVVKIGLFGSHRRNEAGQESDIDLLVTLARPSFDDYMDVKLYLEDLFGRKVDLVLETGLRPELRPNILGEVVYAKGI